MAHRSLLLLAPDLRRQFGVISVGQAAARGVGDHELRRLRTTGLLRQLQRGVLRCPAYPDSWEARAVAAMLAAGPRAVLSGWSGARIHGFVARTHRIDLLVPRGVNIRRTEPRPRTSTRLGPSDVLTISPFRVPTVAFLLADLAATCEHPALARLTARVIADRKLDPPTLSAVLERFAGVPGVRALRRVADEPEVAAAPATRSRDERRFRALVLGAGLPAPTVNLRVLDAAGRPRELDAAWPQQRVAVEIDQHPVHGTTIGRRADGVRQNDLILEWTILRFDRPDLREAPDRVVAQVERTLRAAGWRPGIETM